MEIIIAGHVGSDTGYTAVNTVTGAVTHVGGNRYDDFKRALQILKLAADIKDMELQKAAIKLAGQYLQSKDAPVKLGPDSNIVVLM